MDQAEMMKWGFFDRSSFKSEARRFFRFCCLWEPSLTAVGYLDQIANGTVLSAAFYLLPTAVGNGAMNKFGNCSQWRSKLFSIGNGAMKAPRYWQWRNECSELLESSLIMPSGPLQPVQLHIGAMNFILTLAIWSRIAKSCTRWRWILKVLSQDWGRADFSKNLCDSLFRNDFQINLILADPSCWTLVH
jgi:hypothetical protein